MGEAADIQELAERLLSYPTPDGEHQVRLLPGRLPDNVNLPLPADARLIGSLVREPGYQTDRDIEVILDAPFSEEELLAFYEQALSARGWKANPDFMSHGGGFSAFPVGQQRMFRREGTGLALFVHVRPTKMGGTEARVRSQWIPEPDPNEFRPRPYGQDLLPPLRPPTGVRLRDLGGGGGSGAWTSNATVETTEAAAELEPHFASQLAAAGWKRLAGAVAGQLACSTWAVPGTGDRYGYLFVLEAPGENSRSLWLRVELAGRGHDGGWFSATSELSSIRRLLGWRGRNRAGERWPRDTPRAVRRDGGGGPRRYPTREI